MTIVGFTIYLWKSEKPISMILLTAHALRHPPRRGKEVGGQRANEGEQKRTLEKNEERWQRGDKSLRFYWVIAQLVRVLP